jgi:1-acyl-sn-glycerol-3-phosphate acyltransferase
VVGWLAARAGTLFIRRGEGQAGAISAQISERLQNDGLLTLFPEGTTTDGTGVRPFFSRLFAAGVETRSEVVPVALRYHIDGAPDPIAPYTGDQSLGDNLLGLMRRRGTTVHVHFGQPVSVDGLSRREIAKAAHDAVVAGLAAPRTMTGIDLKEAAVDGTSIPISAARTRERHHFVNLLIVTETYPPEINGVARTLARDR